MFRYVILGLLRDGGRSHGYALAKQYRNRSGVKISSGNVYRELQRLAARGLVRIVPNPDGADARRAPYQITQSGCQAFDAWLAETSAFRRDQQADELSSRALFLGEAEPTTVQELLAHWHEELWIRSKILERSRDAARSRRDLGKGPERDALLILSTRRLKQIAADIECVAELRAAHQDWLARCPGGRDLRTSPASSKSDLKSIRGMERVEPRSAGRRREAPGRDAGARRAQR